VQRALDGVSDLHIHIGLSADGKREGLGSVLARSFGVSNINLSGENARDSPIRYERPEMDRGQVRVDKKHLGIATNTLRGA